MPQLFANVCFDYAYTPIPLVSAHHGPLRFHYAVLFSLFLFTLHWHVLLALLDWYCGLLTYERGRGVWGATGEDVLGG